MTTAAMSAPVVPPRPARAQEKDNGAVPTIPARPAKRFNRSISPNPDRFAPSPLNESPFNPKPKRNSHSFLGEELDRSTSVDMPGVGEEGQEYAAAIEELSSPSSDPNRSSSPEQTRMIGDDIKLHAPKPTVPAASAKQRVATVTRTDSDRAAAFGIGRPSSAEPNARGLKKKASVTSQLSHHSELHTDDEHGIPEIGQRVPMLAYAGDVQAPSPAPQRAPSVDSTRSGRHHSRRASSRAGFQDLPPGSYGLHGHGVESTDKLEKAYYEKHPELYQKEHHHSLHDRVHDYSMSSENLNKIVRDTASRGVGFGTSEYVGTPSEQVGFQASDEYASRISTPQPLAATHNADSTTPPVKNSFTSPSNGKESDVIHVEDNDQYSAFAKHGDEASPEGHGASEDAWPILAADEVAKDPSSYAMHPAVPPNRTGSEEVRSRPTSRPSSRPASIYSPPPPELHSTPLEDVEEYEPLFPEDEKSSQKPKTAPENLEKYRQRFPSQDIWEDAPNSVHGTAEVSTPEPADTRPKTRTNSVDHAETPAQEFARKQEELAEKEALTPDSFLNRQQGPKSWVEHQPHLVKEKQPRPIMTQRFPSRDVWEDTPDSLQFTTTVSHPQSTNDSPIEEPTQAPSGASPVDKPNVPVRPVKGQGLVDDGSKPTIPSRPKPQIPARPAKSVPGSNESADAGKEKPTVPTRPVGGKIAALQAGFMSDLNNRLKLGPHAPVPKKNPPAEEAAPEEREKAPLADARKGRARGPQRRAPTKSKSPSTGSEKSVPPSVSTGHPVLSFSMTRTLWSIDEEGTMTVDDLGQKKGNEIESTVKEIQPEETEPEDIHMEETKPEEARVDELPTAGTEHESMHKLESQQTAPEQAPLEHTEPETKQQDESEKDLEKVSETEREQKQEPNETARDSETISTGDEVSAKQATTEETKTLVTNTAGESILTDTISKTEGGDEVKAVEETKDEVKS